MHLGNNGQVELLKNQVHRGLEEATNLPQDRRTAMEAVRGRCSASVVCSFPTNMRLPADLRQTVTRMVRRFLETKKSTDDVPAPNNGRWLPAWQASVREPVIDHSSEGVHTQPRHLFPPQDPGPFVAVGHAMSRSGRQYPLTQGWDGRGHIHVPMAARALSRSRFLSPWMCPFQSRWRRSPPISSRPWLA